MSLPDFTRIAWASPQAQSVWAERIRRVSQAWEQIERLSVLDGLRSSALQSLSPDALPAVSAWAASVGLHALLLERTGAGANYSASASPVVEGQPWAYRVAIATPAAAMRWPDAWREKDDDAIGRMLGFPSCCRQFFAETWGKGLVDTTWEMAERDLWAPCVNNILLRWLGIRAVPHLPCAFACVETTQRGNEFVQCGIDHGFKQEMDWLEEMLDWPVEWSALHGIAEILTPVCRIQTRTNPSSERLVIRREGSRYPAEGAKGVRFPFRDDCAPVLTPAQLRRASRVKDRLVPRPHPEDELIEVDPREWTDNGFKSKAAMDAAHAKLLAAAGPGPFRSVVDLGCGNGALLQKIPARIRIGVESDSAKVERARKVVSVGILGDCTDAERVRSLAEFELPDLIIAQAHRNPPEMFPGFRVLSYSYDEPSFARLIEVPKEVSV